MLTGFQLGNLLLEFGFSFGGIERLRLVCDRGTCGISARCANLVDYFIFAAAVIARRKGQLGFQLF